ncbi:MAG: hypothetical protein HW390_2312 [Candidatus Brocadiaceae bacterium]|nr:hypothetical protein [Candidatus Brocadiaceae bacterium]
MKKIEFVAAIIVPMLFITACSKKTHGIMETKTTVDDAKRATSEKVIGTVTAKDVKRETGEALETTKNYVAQQKEKYQKDAESTLNDINNKIKGLQSKAEQAGADTKDKYNEIIEGLRKKQEEAQTKLGDLKSRSADAWEDVKSGMDAVLENLKTSCNDAISHFK